MKSIRSILAGITGLFAMLFLTSCGSAGESAPEPVTESFTVLLVVDEENRSLLIGGKADGSGEAATVSVRNLDITGPDGTAFDFAGHIGHRGTASRVGQPHRQRSFFRQLAERRVRGFALQQYALPPGRIPNGNWIQLCGKLPFRRPGDIQLV